MPTERSDVFSRVKSIEREHDAVRFATHRLLFIVQNDPTQLDNIIEIRDLRTASDKLEATYFVRLFAEFEAALRNFWQTTRKKDPPSRTRDLLDGIGAREKIPNDVREDAHKVREFRNSLVHEGENELKRLDLRTARKYLLIFLGRLPPNW